MDRETYLSERRALVEAEADQARFFDRAILTLTAGALGLSLGFVHEMVLRPSANSLLLLFFGWGTFIGSLLLTLVSFQVSQSAFRRQRDILDAVHSGASAKRGVDTRNKPAFWTNVLNTAALILFICGAALLAIFVGSNVER